MSQPAEAPPVEASNAEALPDAPSDANVTQLAVREDQAGATSTVPVLVLPDAPSFEDLRALVTQEAESLTQAFGGRAGRLDLGSRAVDLFDLRRLIHHLEDSCGCAITGLYATEAAVRRFAERELKLKLFVDGQPTPQAPTADQVEADQADADAVPELLQADPAAQDQADAGADPQAAQPDPPAAKAVQVDLDPDGLREAEVSAPADQDEPEDQAEPEPTPAAEPAGRRTLQVHRTVRSGNAVRFDGDVTVFGDVNPGAQVTASGSIIVLGALKGVAHAGATGDESAFILGLSLQPTQLRIGRRIAIASDDRGDGPELALIRDERIVIEPYRSSSMARAARR